MGFVLIIFQMDTFIDAWNAVFEVNKGGKVVETVFLGLGQIADLDERNVMDVALVVDVLQLFEHVQVFLVGLVVCKYSIQGG